MSHQIPCPFVYANGRPCQGHINRIGAYGATVHWTQRPTGEWLFTWEERSHYHLFCSQKGGHAGMGRPDDPRMKYYGNQSPQDMALAFVLKQSIANLRYHGKSFLLMA
jgi:hypothetical protein